jgi:tetratricopeptide (TPR) repeat protein
VSYPPARAATALALLTLTLSCAGAEPARRADPEPPSRDARRDRLVRCVQLAEAMQRAERGRHVIDAVRISPRFEADDETLEPLLTCLGRIRSRPSLDGRARFVRVMEHAYGLAVVQSRTLDDADKLARLRQHISQRDVAAYWLARLRLSVDDTDGALHDLEGALRANPELHAARLLQAEVHVAREAPQAARAALQAAPPGLRGDLQAWVRARAADGEGDPAAALEAYELALSLAADAKVPEADPDSIAARSLPRVDAPAVHCRTGALHEAAGTAPERAAEAYERGGCAEPLARLEMSRGRPFEALLAIKGGGLFLPSLLVDIYAALGARRSAREVLRGQLEVCERLEGGERCVEQRARMDGLAAESTATDAATRGRLEAPRLLLFEAAPAPLVVASKPSPTDFEPAPGHLLVVAEAVGERAVAITISRDLDARGDAWPGGYWLWLWEKKAPVAWSGPYYLGLAPSLPFVLDPASSHPRSDGVTLSLIAQVDPVGAAERGAAPAPAVEGAVSLKAPLEALKRDSDGDGLPDLYEEKILTDPTDADSDGDGIGDAEDRLPNASGAKGPRHADEDAITRRVLGRALFDDESLMLRGEADPGLQTEQVLFIQTSALSLDEAGLPLRIITLPPTLSAAYREKFGPTELFELGEVVFAPDGQRAFLEYRFGWRGGGFVAHKGEAGWSVERLVVPD